ncbi:hypothetical protein RZS08_04145, partial [Arthrospira platensis SPKY1]|nr:hypothetical protein [Arthrospira platensis SPKY1]
RRQLDELAALLAGSGGVEPLQLVLHRQHQLGGPLAAADARHLAGEGRLEGAQGGRARCLLGREGGALVDPKEPGEPHLLPLGRPFAGPVEGEQPSELELRRIDRK